MTVSNHFVRLFVSIGVLIIHVQGQYDLYMDSVVNCGRRVDIYDREYNIKARADVSTSNPDYRCVITVSSGYTDSFYQLQITQSMVDINDCGVSLKIYNGPSASGTTVKSLSCTTKSTGILYSKGGTVTFELITPKQLYTPRNDFSIKVKAYRDPNAPPLQEGTSRLAAGAIVGIIVGIVIFVAFTIIMFWCYKKRKLPGMEAYRKSKRAPSMNNRTAYTNSDYNYSKEPSIASTDAASKKLYLEDQGVFPSINSLANSSLNGSAAGLNAPKKVPISNWNIHTGRNDDPNFHNGTAGRSRYISETENRGRYQKGPPGRDRTQSRGESPSRRRDGEFRKNNIPPAPPPPQTETGARLPSIERNDDNEISGVKQRRQKMNQGENENDVKRPNSGIFENPDKEGYMYDYDQVKTLSGEDLDDNQGNQMLHELKRELERRQSVKETKGENGEKQTYNKKSDDAPGAPVSKVDDNKVTKDKSNLPETGKIEGKLRPVDQQSEIGDPDIISNPLIGSSNPAIRASVSELRDSPGARKKKRRKSHKKYVKADPVTGGDTYKNVDESSTERTIDMDESFDRDSMFNDSFRLPKSGKDIPLPPEALAPIFAADESVMQHYYPQNQYGMQNLVYPILGYDAFGNPVYGNPVQIQNAVPYDQAGQPVYYVDQNGYQVQMPQQPMQYQNPTDFHPGMPGYTSTPANIDQTPHRKHRTKSVPYNALVATPGAPSPIMPAVAILDDPRIPPPGTTLMNSGVDPKTGIKTSQVVWTDANPDPTDPTGDNPQITRQTVVRVTARDTENGQLPHPNAGLQQMTFSAAKQLKNAGNTDPAFLSPSKGPGVGSTAYTPKPVYASQTPERDNAAFYTRTAPPELSQITKSPKPVVHSPARNYSVRDQITLKPEEHEF